MFEQRRSSKGATAFTTPSSRTRTESSLSTVPAFVVVLVSTAGCVVVLGAVVSLYATYARSTHVDLGARGITNEFRTKFNMSPLKDTSCSSQLYQWNKKYILGVVDNTKDPCDDFYAHVCNPRRWHTAGSGNASRPFADFSTAQLLEDMERFFRYFVELRGKPVGDNFLARMMWVYDACKRDTGAKLNVSAELADIFNASGLSGVMRLDNRTAGSIARMIATGDKHLRLHPLFQVHVLGTGPLKATVGYYIVISAPETPYRRFVTRFPGTTDSEYVDLVTRALTQYSATKTQAMARQVMLLEKRLERMMLASEEQIMMPPREKYVSLEHLFLSERWDWSVYFNILFENTGESVSNDTEVFVNDPVYFRSLGMVLTSQWEPVIVNYMTFKVIVELAPVLGPETEYLVRLTHDYDVPYLDERQVACFGFLEKLFKYGTGIAAKLTLGKEFATTPRLHIDDQLSSLFSASRQVIADLVEAGRSWLSSDDKAIALRKLRDMRFEFGSQCNLVEYELYRRASDADHDPHLPAPSVIQNSERRGALRRWNQYSLPRVVFDLYSLASQRYWSAWGSNSSRAYDNRYAVTTFRPGYELQQTGDLLVLPHAIVAFLSHLSNVIDPVLYGVVAVHVLRGILEALTRSGSSLDADLLSRPWWGIATIDTYENISSCLESQYQPFLAEGTRIRTLERDYIDNAILYPLFRLYRDEVTIRREVNVTDPSESQEDGERSQMDQMFFYNFVIALCDLRDEESWRRQKLFHITPAPWRVNVPLRNFPEFAKAFKCRLGSKMNPERRCAVWKDKGVLEAVTDTHVRHRIIS